MVKVSFAAFSLCLGVCVGLLIVFLLFQITRAPQYRWERFLYLPKVPSLDDTVFIDETHRVQVRKNLQNIMSTPERPFANLDNRANFTEEVAFMLYYLEVITFRLQCKLVYQAFQEGDFFK